MIKIIIGILLFVLFSNTYGNPINDYKKQLIEEILYNINLKIPEILEKNNNSKEDILSEGKKLLEELKEYYDYNDFEYSVIEELIDKLTLEESLIDGETNGNEENSENNYGDSNEGDENSQDDNIPTQPRGESMGLGGDYEEGLKPLSQDELFQIESYLDELMKEESENMKLNNQKNNTYDIFDDIRNKFFDFDLGGNESNW